MPAKRRKQKIIDSANKKKKTRLLWIVGFLISVILLFSFLLSSSRNYWDGENLMPLVVYDESITVFVLDPQHSLITEVVIPKNTQVEAAENKGLWKVSTLWDLKGEKETQGDFLVKTIARSFHFPVAAWIDSKGVMLIKGNILQKLYAAFTARNSNLSLTDRLSVVFFASGVKNADYTTIDLAKTDFLDAKTLLDGEEGYVLSGRKSAAWIYSYFVSEEEAQKPLVALIKVSSFNKNYERFYSEQSFGNEIGSLIEVVGVKTGSIKTIDTDDISCEVRAKSESKGLYLSRILNCDYSKIAPEGSYDIELVVGNSYIEKY